jgi:hypothetical protein
MEFVAIAYIGPIVLLVVHARLRLVRRRKLLIAAEAEIERKRAAGLAQDFPPIYFEPHPESALDPLLRRFDLPHRMELRRQYPLARFGFFAVAYILLTGSLAGLMPGEAEGYGYQELVWQNYQRWFVYSNIWAMILSFLTAGIAVAPLQIPQAVFTRTRPLAFAFVFRVRVWFALAVLLAGAATAIVLSHLILLTFDNAVVEYAPHAFETLLYGDLTLLLVCVFTFGFAVFLSSFPWSGKQSKKGGIAWFPGLIGTAVGSQLLHGWRFAHKAVQSGMATGRSHPVVSGTLLELLAIPLVAGLLLLAERICARSEL